MQGCQRSGSTGSAPELELLPTAVVSPPVDDELDEPSDDALPSLDDDEDPTSPLLLLLLAPADITPVEPMSSGGTHALAVDGLPSPP